MDDVKTGDLLLMPPGRPVMSQPSFVSDCLEGTVFDVVPAKIVMVVACYLREKNEVFEDDFVTVETSWPWALVSTMSSGKTPLVGWVWLGALDRAGTPRKL